MSKYRLVFILFFTPVMLLYAQKKFDKIIHGKIISVSESLEGVTIINLVNNSSTVSDSKGDFFISANANDLLVLSSINFEPYRKIKTVAR